jgi:hypothetical protein
MVVIMCKKLIKNFSLMGFSFASSILFAGMDMDSRVSQLESQMKEVRTKTENETYGALTASNAPQLKDGCGFFVGLGAVYQTAILGQTDFGYTSNQNIGDLPFHGNFMEAKNSWAWGINAQVGYNMQHDQSYVALTNNYFDMSTTRKVSVSNPSKIDPTRMSDTFNSNAASDAVSDWSLTYDLLGIEVGRDFFFSRYFSVKSSVGLLSSWIWLTNDISYTGAGNGTNSQYVEDKSNFWGIGPQVGTVMSFGLMNGFSLFADLKGALMYGRLRVQNYEKDTNTDNDNLNLKAYSHQILPYVTATIGLSYDMTTEGKGNHFKFRAGYNAQYFIGANQMIYPVHINDPSFKRESGALQTSGLVLDATWSF